MNGEELRAALDEITFGIRDVSPLEPDERMIPTQHSVGSIRKARAALAAPSTPEPEYDADGDPIRPDPHSNDWYAAPDSWLRWFIESNPNAEASETSRRDPRPPRGVRAMSDLRAALYECFDDEAFMAAHLNARSLADAVMADERVRAALAAPSTPEPEYDADGDPIRPDPHSNDWYDGYAAGQREAAAPSTEPALDVDPDTLIVAMLEAVKRVAIRHGINPTEFLDAAFAASNDVRRLAESQPAPVTEETP